MNKPLIIDVLRKEVFMARRDEQSRNWLTAMLLSIFLGCLGIDRIYLGYTTLGILKLVTVGGFGFWYVIDLVLIATNRLPDAQGRYLKDQKTRRKKKR